MMMTIFFNMFSIIPLPANFISNITTTTTDIIADLAPFATLIIGVLLGVVLLEILIHAIRK
jgi:hypothetical protein